MPVALLHALVLALALAPGWSRAAQTAALATIVEGEAVLLRETARHALAEGVVLLPGDIVETAADAGIVRLELTAGPVLDLGPDTRVWLAPRLRDARRPRPATVYLLQGWVKLALPAAATTATVASSPAVPANATGIASALADIATLAGTTVERVLPESVGAFQESGQASVVEAAAARGAAPRVLRGGEAYAWHDGKSSTAPRPDPPFVGALPRAFRDTLPRRAAAFQGKERPPRLLPAPGYDDLEPWLMAEPAVRLALLPRWQRLAANPDFRRALVAHRPAYPEWERILFPPPPASAATGGEAGALLPRPGASPAYPAGAGAASR